jgi:NADPH-dependent glutamate synthase beta subunit-like oxidoreductase
MPISVAIVGSGPSGFYTAEALAKAEADVEVDIIERLPAPHGLIRYGVAPDHQTTKNVSRAFDKTAGRSEVQYFGNIDIGRDLSLQELRDTYDAVVLAVGSPYDRKLGIPGEDKAGVIGSAEFVGWYNGHPDFCDINPHLDTANVVVVGNGNVAIDCARVLCKTREELAPSDMSNHIVDAIQAAPITDVYMVGRRGPVEAKFTNVELREMGELTNCAAVIDGAIVPDAVPEDDEMSDRDRRLKDKNLGTLQSFVGQEQGDRDKRVHFEFFAAPVEIMGGDRVEAIRFERTKVRDGRAVGTGNFFEIETGLVIPAIGYLGQPFGDLPFREDWGIIPNEDSVVGDGVYVVGWIGRGPTGTIGTNRPDGQAAARHILEDFSAGGKAGRGGLIGLLNDRGVRRIDYAEWLKVDAHEKATARDEAPREKVVTVADMLSVIDA